MSCKIVRVVGNAGDPSVADTLIAVPARPKKRRDWCNCAARRGKHVRAGDCSRYTLHNAPTDDGAVA